MIFRPKIGISANPVRRISEEQVLDFAGYFKTVDFWEIGHIKNHFFNFHSRG